MRYTGIFVAVGLAVCGSAHANVMLATVISAASMAAAPVPTGISPNRGYVTDETPVTITGYLFSTSGTTRVTFGGVEATNVMVRYAGYDAAPYITCNTPAHAAGTVNVAVINPNNESATLSGAFTYTATSQVPTAAFKADKTTGKGCVTVQFTDQSTPDAAAILSRLWDFGDGSSSDTFRTLQNPCHVFANPGTYTVSLTVTSSMGSNTAAKTAYITVAAVPIVYIDIDSVADTPDGTTWATAYRAIQEGVDAADAAGGGEVWVAEGTYTSTNEPVVTMKANVHLFGGFIGGGSGGNETLRSQRDWAAHPAVIDGEDARRCTAGANDATLDGFTVTRGASTQSGGGMYNCDTSPRVANCTFSYNTAVSGAGMYNWQSSPPVANCTFTHNTGGGVWNSYSSPFVANSTFTRNTGDGMANGGSSPYLVNCRFDENDGNGMRHTDYPASFPVLNNCVFTRNTWNGIESSSNRVVPTAINCTFAANAALGVSGHGNLINCISWGDIGGEANYAQVIRSCVQGGHAGTLNIGASPCFFDSSLGDVRLRPFSPCLDAGMSSGSPSVDIRNTSRPQGTGVDMGAYEMLPEEGIALYGDSDGDGMPNDVETAQGCDPDVADARLSATIDQPSDGIYSRTAPIALEGRLSSPAVTCVSISFDNGATWASTGTITGLAWSYSFTPPAAGTYSVEVLASNRFGGYTTTGPVTVHYQPNMPAAAITAPACNTHVSDSVDITGTAGEGQLGFGSYTLSYRAGTDCSGDTGWTTLTTSTTAVSNGTLYSGWDVAALSDGPYAVRLYVVDGSSTFDATTSTLIYVDRDSTPPAAPSSITIAGNVLPGAVASGDALTVTGLAEAGTAIEEAAIVDADAGTVLFDVTDQVGMYLTGRVYGWPVTASPIDAAAIALRVTVKDSAGNVSAAAQSNVLPVDDTGPVLAVDFPQAGSTVPNSVITVFGTSSDTPAGVQKVECSTNGTVWTLATGTTAWRYDWTPAADGACTIYVRATDDLGNISSTQVSTTVSTGYPFAYVSTPASGARIHEGAAVPITGRAADDTDFSWYKLQYAAGASPSAGWKNITANVTVPVLDGTLAAWDTTGLAEGTYTIRLIALDQAGHSVLFDRLVNMLTRVSVEGLPDVTLDENTTKPDAVHLPAYVTALSGDPETFTYSIVGNTHSECGATVDDSRNLDVAPQALWSGYSDITIQVTNGTYTDTDTLRITVNGDGSITPWGSNGDGLCDVPDPNAHFVTVTAGGDHNLGLKSDGSVVAWGYNYYGQCDVPGPNTGFVAVAAGADHSLGLKLDGSLIAWGYNDYGQCNVPGPNAGFVAVAAGDHYNLGLKSDGSVVAWGSDFYGECDVPSPNAGFVAVAAGAYHSLGLKSDGSVVAWGDNGFSQCDVPSPNAGFVAVVAGVRHSLGLKSDGSVIAWGNNGQGQCDVPNPNTAFVAIDAGYYYSLAVKSDGSVVAWGDNSYGQCDLPNPNAGFVAVTAGYVHSMALALRAAPPVIYQHPFPVTVANGGAALFAVRAVGAGTLSYQWRKDGVAVADATRPAYSIALVQSSDHASYDCVVSNGEGSTISGTATLTPIEPVAFTIQPQSATVNPGTAASFHVTATGTAPFSYQWKKSGAVISGATGAAYDIASAQQSDEGTYACVVANVVGSATSNAAALSVNDPVAFTAQPQSLTVNMGAAASFHVTATGTAPLEYQWKKGGAVISGATNAAYDIASVQEPDTGSYTCVVANVVGSETSNAAVLSVNDPVVFTAQPSSQTVTAGSGVSFSVAATGTGPLSYQWKKDGADISGATSADFAIAAATAGDAGLYTCVVSNVTGSVASSTAVLTVHVGPLIAVQPQSQTVDVGDAFTFSLTATGTGPLSYQWKKDGADISWATQSSFTLSGAQIVHNGAYLCVVSNMVGSVTSDTAVLTVNRVVTPPEADFEAAPRTGITPVAVQFTDASVYHDLTPEAWSWTFGDGGTSTEPNPAHTYRVAGTYTVSLTVTTSDGSDTETKPGFVSVTASAESGTIDGVVTDSSRGTPLEGVTVELYDATSSTLLDSAVTETSGQYTVVAPDRGAPLRLQYAKAEYEAKVVDSVPAPPATVNVWMTRSTPWPPAGLSALVGFGHVLLRWEANSELDLAYYNVYRDGELISTGPVPDPMYEDDTAVSQQEYTYQVTAVDTDGDESGKSDAAAITAGVISAWIPNQSAGINYDENAFFRTVRVPVNVTNAWGILPHGLTVWFSYDTNLVESVSVKRSFITRGLSVLANTDTPGQISITYAGNAAALSGEGTLFNLMLTLKSGLAAPAYGAMRLDLMKFSDAQGNDIPVNYDAEKTLYVSQGHMLGDLSEDGVVEAGDALKALRLSVGLDTAEAWMREAGDMNGDQIVDCADAIMMMRQGARMNLYYPDPAKEAGAAVPWEDRALADLLAKSTGVEVSAGSLEATADGEVSVPIAIDDATGVSGVDLTISYPSDLTLDSVGAGTLLEGSENVQLEHNASASQSVRVSYSDLSALASGAGSFVTLQFHVGTGTAGQTLPVRLNEVRLRGQYGENFDWYTSVSRKDGEVAVAGLVAGSLAGVVTDSVTNAAITGALVEIAGAGIAATTGQDGAYVFAALAAGTYTVRVSATGYQDAQGSAVVDSGAITTHNVALAPAGEGEGEGEDGHGCFGGTVQAPPSSNGTRGLLPVIVTMGLLGLWRKPKAHLRPHGR